MQSNNEHFNSYDILIPQVEILTIQTNDSIKNIEILKNGFLQFANESKQNISQIQSQMKEYNDKIKQNLKKIDDWKSNNNYSPVNSNDDLINEYKNEINQNIEDLKNLINNIEDEMKTRKEEIDNVYIKLYIYILQIKNSLNDEIYELKQHQQQQQQQEQQQQLSEDISTTNSPELIKIINQLISDKISQFYIQDTIAKPDYALYVTGTRIVHDALYTSQTYQPEHNNNNILHKLTNIFGIGLKLNSPEIIIQVFIYFIFK